MDDYSKTFYKITNNREIVNGIKFHDGLNISKLSLCEGNDFEPYGFSFCAIENLFDFLDSGFNVREVTLPYNDPDFKVHWSKYNYFMANKIILGQTRRLSDVETFDYFVSLGSKLTPKIFLCASSLGNLSVIEHFIKKIPMNNDILSSCLSKACSNGYLDIVKFFIKKYARYNCYNCSYVYDASVNGHIDIVKYLYENRTNRNKPSETDPISKCYKGNHIDIIIYLLEKDFYKISVSDADYVIVLASKKGDCKFLNYFLKFIEKINIKVNLDSALSSAAENGHLEPSRILINKGADIHTNSDYPFRLACESGCFELVQYLIDLGADIAKYGLSAMYYAIEKGHLNIIKLLICKGVNINNNIRILQFAVESGKIDVVEFFIGLGISSRNHIALCIASSRGYIDIVKLLVASGADINTSKYNQFSPPNAFCYACQEGHLELIKYYLGNGINIAMIDEGLFWACKKTHLDVVKFLVLWMHSLK